MSNISQEVIDRIREAKEKQLKELNLWYCKLDHIPEEVFSLPNLTYLDLSDNQITTIPETITNLQNLTSLNLWNRI